VPRILVLAALLLCASSPASAQSGDVRDAGVLRTALVTLAAGSASLQAYDAYTTLSAIPLGAVETNPLMRGLAGRPAAFVALKAGVATSTILAGTQLWRQHHRKAAVILLGLANGAMAGVAVHNASVLRSMRRRAH
jgi:hypothetical protein